MDTPQFNALDKDAWIMHKLGSIESKLTAIEDKLDAKERDQDEDIKTLQKEVGELKKARNWQLGFAAGISFVVGLITSLVKLPWQNLS